jgi:membrane protein DedA with SNARE-associated domain
MWNSFGALGLGALARWSDNAANWAVDHGYPAIAVIVAGDGVIPLFPGETVVVTGGNFANQGKLSLLFVMIAGFVGAILGDNIAYWIGRLGGERIHRIFRKFAGAERVAAADRMVQERGAVLVTAGRFLPGIRLAINLSCGAGNMSWKKFATFNALGASVWSAQAALLGYAFGNLFKDNHLLGLAVAIGVALLMGAAVTVYEHRRVRTTNRVLASEAAEHAGGNDG